MPRRMVHRGDQVDEAVRRLGGYGLSNDAVGIAPERFHQFWIPRNAAVGLVERRIRQLSHVSGALLVVGERHIAPRSDNGGRRPTVVIVKIAGKLAQSRDAPPTSSLNR